MGSVTDISAARGRDEFVSVLSRTHGAQLLRFLQRMLGQKQMAEDVAQDTYLKIYRLAQPGDVRCPRALLFDVATKLALDQMRKLRAEAACLSEPRPVRIDGEPEAPEGIEAVPDESSLPERLILVEEAMQRLTEIINEMPPSLRYVLCMRYITQRPRQDIANQLHISIGAVEQRLTRALTHCRERLTAAGIDWITH